MTAQLCGFQGWAQGREVEAEARRGSNVLNRGKAESSIEAEARQTKFEARPRRGKVKSTMFVSF